MAEALPVISRRRDIFLSARVRRASLPMRDAILARFRDIRRDRHISSALHNARRYMRHEPSRHTFNARGARDGRDDNARRKAAAAMAEAHMPASPIITAYCRRVYFSRRLRCHASRATY